jgi:5-methylcytosine-specific restriction protein A
MYEIDDLQAGMEEDGEGEDASSLSWTLEDGSAIKQADRHVFLFREAVMPQDVRTYFGVESLEPGQKTWIMLRYGDRRFDAFIEKTMHATPRTRLMWKADFAAVLQKEYPQWVEFFKKSREASGDAPWLAFTKRQEPGQFTVELEGVRAEKITGEFSMPLEPGDVVENETLRALFRCSLQGSLRRSAAAGGLVLVADHTQPWDEDKWIGKVFHFTGMGAAGEEGPESRQNRTLAESRETGVRLWLFEVFTRGQYTYIGEVGLMDSPYRSRQAGADKTLRDVLVFPLAIKGHKNPPLLKKEDGGETTLRTLEEITRETRTRPEPVPEPAARLAFPDLFAPDPDVAECARRNANGLCQLCGLAAPFTGHDGQPYLEIHHIVPLGEGGTDTIGNVAALCPNCHRKMHILKLQTDVARLKKRTGPAG